MESRRQAKVWDFAWYLLDMKRLCSFVFANSLFECKMHFDEWMRHSFMLPQLVHSVSVIPKAER